MQALEETDREVILLCYFAGKSASEIALALGTTSAAIRKRLQRARERLGERLLTTIAEAPKPGKRETAQIMGIIGAASTAWNTTGVIATQGVESMTGYAPATKFAAGLALVLGATVGIYFASTTHRTAPPVKPSAHTEASPQGRTASRSSGPNGAGAQSTPSVERRDTQGGGGARAARTGSVAASARDGAAKDASTGYGHIRGVVTLDNVAVPGASISVQTADRASVKQVSTDDSGAYIVQAPAAELRLVATLPGSDEATGSRNMKRIAIVEDRLTTNVNFPFASALATLTGRITVEGEAPRSQDVFGYVYTESGEETFQAISDSDGTYIASGLAAGIAKVRVRVESAEQMLTRDGEVVLSEGETTEFNVDFSQGGVLSGALKGIIPGENKGVSILPSTFELPTNASDVTPEMFLEMQRALVSDIHTDDEGGFRDESLPPGEYVVVGYSLLGREAADFRNGKFAITRVSIAAGQVTEIELNLK